MPNVRPNPTAPQLTPIYCNTYHSVGRMALGVSNDGTFATGLAVSASDDYFTGDELPSCEFPDGSRTIYCFGADIWIGAVLERDTLVSTGADGWSIPGNEFHPDERPMVYRSTIDPARPEYEGAVSEQDYVCWYYDTCRNCSGVSPDEVDGRAHVPLNIEVTQSTYSWSYSYAQDFVLFDYGIKNIGDSRLRRVYMGVYVDADIHDQALDASQGSEDDFCGFRHYQPALYLQKNTNCPQDSDQVNIAWTADNDGDFGRTGYTAVPHITAARIIRTPSDSLEVSFNWWVSNGDDPALDFGPQTRDKYRDYGHGGTGTPSGDRNKYHVLTNQEFDYDQPRIASIGPLDSIWLEPPPARKDTLAKGLDTRYVLSFGPFDIEPGQTLPLTLAYVAGLNFHQTADNLDNLPLNPDVWYQGVLFDSLGSNATWAEWIYDNPGVDTDSDGYAGTFTVCRISGDSTYKCDTTVDSSTQPWDTSIACHWDYDVADTIWRKGDGVPDFQGASPPPSPSTYTLLFNGERTRGLRVEPTVGMVRVIWNGVLSENTEDVFSREIDFEGYRVWIARDDRRSSYSLAASFDIEDFNRYDHVPGTSDYELNESPFSLQELRCLYAPNGCDDDTWHPLDYPRNNPLVISASEIYYFLPQDFNRSILGNYPNATTDIKKVYPNAPRPPLLDPDSIRILYPPPNDTVFLTPEGFIKAYEYEYTFENLLPTVPYWINVTAFDYGSPQSGLAALETSPTVGSITTYALESTQAVAANGSTVFVYPNPYRLDGAYRDLGFEARGELDRPEDRTRAVHFANLPPVCTIRIFTLDGDLVREIEHNVAVSDPLANHETWDLITRNSQLVVSGLYYWSVEEEGGHSQIGKLVVIM